MKSKFLLLAYIFSMTTLSFNVFSQESSLNLSDFFQESIFNVKVFPLEPNVCIDPLKTICSDTKNLRLQRDAYIDALKHEIALEANKNAIPRIAEMRKKYKSPIFYIKRLTNAYKIRNQEIMRSAKSRIGGIESVVTNPNNILMLKNYMKQAIDESNFSQATRTYFKSTIDSIIIGNFGDYLERSGLEDSFLSQLLNNPCGSDGMVANAFATTLENSNVKQRYVLICPGFLISLSQTANEKEKINSILLAISHEMGHHIDNAVVGNQVYGDFLTCISKNYFDQLNSSNEDKKFCRKKARNQAECNLKIAISHGGELIADQWGIKTLAIHARTQGYSTPDTESLLTDSWVNLCGSGDEGIHPSAKFRIGTMLRLNPEISDYLSCNNSAVVRPSCTFDGAINL